MPCPRAFLISLSLGLETALMGKHHACTEVLVNTAKICMGTVPKVPQFISSVVFTREQE